VEWTIALAPAATATVAESAINAARVARKIISLDSLRILFSRASPNGAPPGSADGDPHTLDGFPPLYHEPEARNTSFFAQEMRWRDCTPKILRDIRRGERLDYRAERFWLI
jgi:hypothetical protein